MKYLEQNRIVYILNFDKVILLRVLEPKIHVIHQNKRTLS